MASIPSQELAMPNPSDPDHVSVSPSKTQLVDHEDPLEVEREPNPNGLNHASISPSKTQLKNHEDPLEVEKEPNMDSNSGKEIKIYMETGNKTPKSRGRPMKVEDDYDRPVYASRFQDETRNVFMPSDLVWGKVKNHPWWPGLIFDPSDASELSLKHRNKNNYLVAYFFDNTFAWNEASVLKPFQTNFHHMAKQSSSDFFMSAVDEALSVVSWRVRSALSCGCYNHGESSVGAKFENAGVRANTVMPSGDVSCIRSSFDPLRFLAVLCELGQNPHAGFESLDVVVAKSQLKAFNQSRGCSSDLPEFGLSCAFEEETASPVTSDRIYTRKRKFVDGESSEKPTLKKSVPEEEGNKKKKLSEIFNKKEIKRTPLNRHKVRVGGPSGSDNSGKDKKKSLNSLLRDLGTKSKAKRKYLRVGQCMQKTANQVTSTAPTPKPNGVTSRKRKRLSMIKDRIEKKPFQRKKGVVSSDNLSRGKSGRKKRDLMRVREVDVGISSLDGYPSSSEMFSQLCLAARDPLKGYSFITVLDTFFTRFRGYAVNSTGSVKLNLVKNDAQDSNLSDVAVDDDDNRKLITLVQKKQTSRKRGKDNILEGTVISGANPSEDLGNDNKQENNCGMSDANGHETTPEEEESMPTALVLIFKEAAPLPTRAELNGFFTRFGPLKEAETEVSEKENSAQVVFKKHVDAEVAFSNAGKLDAFGADLVSCQLSRAPTSSNMKPTSARVGLPGELDAVSSIKATC